MEHLRIATAEEVAAIHETSDITPRSTVFKFGEIVTVFRNVYEVDPLYSNGAKPASLARFLWGLEERLIGFGVDAYYFDIDADANAEEWRNWIEKWGAAKLSPKPRFRYKRLLTNGN